MDDPHDLPIGKSPPDLCNQNITDVIKKYVISYIFTKCILFNINLH